MSAGALSSEQVAKFHQDGFLVIENFCSGNECDELKKRCFEIIDNVDFSKHPVISYSTQNREHASFDYFKTSGDKIRYFFEAAALNEDGSLKMDPKKSLNKLAHGLHACDPVFKSFTHGDKVKSLVKSLGIERAAIIQGMCILKPAEVGGIVKPHRDSTFLYTEPMHLYGFWLALEDARQDNGCLWFAPGSHRHSATKHVIRKKEGDSFILETVGEISDVDDSQYVPVEAPKGSMVLIHGNVLHKSAMNESDRSRVIYTFHLYDEAKSTYDKKNWLQPSEELPFPILC